MASRIDDLIARRDRVLGPAYRLFYDEPLHIVRGEDVWLYDADGRRYLDTYNNVPHVGHSHARVVEAVSRQIARVNTHTRYLDETVLDYAERLLATFEAQLDTVHFGCSGTEANEMALRLARHHTGHKGVIVTQCAYHGHSQSIYEISTRDVPAAALPDYVATIPAPDTLRGPHRGPDAAARYADHVRAAVKTLQARGHGVAALVLDTIQSSGGTVIPPEGFYAEAAHIVREAGGLFIADEVQCGFARIGSAFWVYQDHGVVPDFVTLGKPMGNGMPLAGCVTQRRYVEDFAKANKYFNTFAGIPVTCAAGLAVLDAIAAQDLQANAARVGDYLKGELISLAAVHDCIGDVRGAGFFIGLDLVRERETLTPDTALTKRLVNRMKDAGVLSGAIGPAMNVLKIRPPMTFREEHADILLEVLDQCLKQDRLG